MLTYAEDREHFDEFLQGCGWAVKDGRDLCSECAKWHARNPGCVTVPLFGKTGIVRSVPAVEPDSYDVSDYIDDWDVLVEQIWNLMRTEQESGLIAEVRGRNPKLDTAISAMERLLHEDFLNVYKGQRNAAGGTDGS